MALQYTRSVLGKILNRVLNWWRLMLVPKLQSSRFKIVPFSYVTPAIEFQEPAPNATTRQLCTSLSVPLESQHAQSDGMIQEFISLQEESKASKKRIVRIENDIECIRSELGKLQMEWEHRQYHLLTEWSDTKEQACDECSEQTMKRKDLDHPLTFTMPKAAPQTQHVTCRQRKDYTMRDEVDRMCSETGASELEDANTDSFHTSADFISQLHESDHGEVMSFTSEPYVKHHITATPLCSLPCGSTSLTSSVASYSSSRPGSSASLPYRFKADFGNDRPLKAYAPRSILDLQIGHRVKVILPNGKIGAGVVKYLGGLLAVPEICLGVELDFPENGLRNGVFAGHCYFHCKPSHGVFVNFSKVLMVLE
ncbi:uncharacterized protein [Heptranchias perlo]|uniref:uncharacterized protein n=1 Tax=Heptranchias perlo TaxID=212740 RepID=UPI003559D3FD